MSSPQPTMDVRYHAEITLDDAWRATGLEPAVFADPSGRRARAMRGAGCAIVLATLAALVIVVTGAVGFSSVPVPVSATAGPGLRAAAPPKRTHAHRELVAAHSAGEAHRAASYRAAVRALASTARERNE